MPIRAVYLSSLLLAAAVACQRAVRADSDSGAVPESLAHDPATRAEIATWTVRSDVYGRLPLGILLTQANTVLGDSLPVDYAKLDLCQMVRSPMLPTGLRFLVERDSVGAPLRIDRVDVDSGSTQTAEGAAIGDTEARIHQLYGNRVKVQPHKYVPTGHYLVIDATTDTLHRLVFETDGEKVVKFRAGRKPAIDYVESCG